MIPRWVPDEVTAEMLAGAGEVLGATGTALLGGHSVRDEELKFGLAVVGLADPLHLLTNAGARPGDRLLLSKPLGTGVLVNAFKADRLDEAGLEPALAGMERLNDEASRLALAHGARAATDITGFGLAGHALVLARASGVSLRIVHAALPVYPGFARLVAAGVSTGCTGLNERFVDAALVVRRELDASERELLFDPQTSGGLLLAVPPASAAALLDALLASGHQAAEIGAALAGPPQLEIV
jgi:selenide,water dikinase